MIIALEVKGTAKVRLPILDQMVKRLSSVRWASAGDLGFYRFHMHIPNFDEHLEDLWPYWLHASR